MMADTAASGCNARPTIPAARSAIKGHLERAAGFDATTARKQSSTLEAMIEQATTEVIATAALLAPLLSIPTGDRYPPLGLTPERQKERTLAALTDQVIGLAASKSLLMIVEDAHWSDPTTLESVDLTIARIETTRVLFLVTFRPEFQPKWLGRPHVTSVSLNRLSKRRRGDGGWSDWRSRSAPRCSGSDHRPTDGVPLFVEELTRMVMESAAQGGGGCFVLEGSPYRPWPSSTLRDSLMARLDRLAPARDVAQTAAAMGGRSATNSCRRSSVWIRRSSMWRWTSSRIRDPCSGRARCRGDFTFKHASSETPRTRACSRASVSDSSPDREGAGGEARHGGRGGARDGGAALRRAECMNPRSSGGAGPASRPWTVSQYRGGSDPRQGTRYPRFGSRSRPSSRRGVCNPDNVGRGTRRQRVMARPKPGVPI